MLWPYSDPQRQWYDGDGWLRPDFAWMCTSAMAIKQPWGCYEWRGAKLRLAGNLDERPLHQERSTLFGRWCQLASIDLGAVERIGELQSGWHFQLHTCNWCRTDAISLLLVGFVPTWRHPTSRSEHWNRLAFSPLACCQFGWNLFFAKHGHEWVWSEEMSVAVALCPSFACGVRQAARSSSRLRRCCTAISYGWGTAQHNAVFALLRTPSKLADKRRSLQVTSQRGSSATFAALACLAPNHVASLCRLFRRKCTHFHGWTQGIDTCRHGVWRIVSNGAGTADRVYSTSPWMGFTGSCPAWEAHCSLPLCSTELCIAGNAFWDQFALLLGGACPKCRGGICTTPSGNRNQTPLCHRAKVGSSLGIDNSSWCWDVGSKRDGDLVWRQSRGLWWHLFSWCAPSRGRTSVYPPCVDMPSLWLSMEKCSSRICFAFILWDLPSCWKLIKPGELPDQRRELVTCNKVFQAQPRATQGYQESALWSSCTMYQRVLQMQSVEDKLGYRTNSVVASI